MSLIRRINSILFGLFIFSMLIACGGSGNGGAGSPATPTLDDLAVTASDGSSITIAKPVFSGSDDPTLKIEAYIGVDGTINVAGSTVSNSIQGPIDVTLTACKFTGLSYNTSYRIIVVAQYSGGYDVKQIVQSTTGIPPVLNNLSVNGSDSDSITLSLPTFSTAGSPLPSVKAYIGIDGTITAAGSEISGATEGPVELSGSGYQFSNLNSNTIYRIIVIAQNNGGYDIKEIAQSTDTVAPVMNNLVVSNFDSASITLSKPSFSTTGNPTPAVRAYIGLDGAISVSGSVVSNYTQGPIDVSAGGNQFIGLSMLTSYRIIVVTQNSKGYDVKQIVLGTKGVAPVLNDLAVTNTDSFSITLAQPSFSVVGNPTTTVMAYIGLSGTITAADGVVSGSTIGPVNVSTGSYRFTGLNSNSAYKIIVVAHNTEDFSIKDINQSTAGIVPVMNEIHITNYDASSITIAQPTFSTTGNPIPTVQAYIGLDSTISVTGTTVGGSITGPVNVAAGGYQFSGLNSGTCYKVIVVAQNSAGNAVQQVSKIALGTIAMQVYGQGGNFTTNSAPGSAIGLNYPRSVISDANGIYITDSNNSRVLYYEGTSTTPTRVYGQNGSFTATVSNNGGVSANSLSYPGDVAIDSGGVYIADRNNHRVLYYAGTSTTATRVYGQGGSFITNTANIDGISANSLNGPWKIAVDAGGVYISDSNNSRVLYYAGISTTASRVYGQGGSFITNTANIGGVSSISLNTPCDVSVNGVGVYIADYYNHRVLYYEGINTTATRVYGQGGSYVTNILNNGGLSANSLSNPSGVSIDAGGVYIADSNNHRVLYYTGTSVTATRVYGQGGGFLSNTANYLGVSANSLNNAFCVEIVTGGIYISDAGNHRVLYYPGADTTATIVYGQSGSLVVNTVNNGSITADNLYGPYGIAVDSSGVYSADYFNNRVLFYSGESTTAIRVYGQGGSFVTNLPNNGGISSSGLKGPTSIAFDAGGIYITDFWNNRVLYYSGLSTAATRVYGQSDFISISPHGASANALYHPKAVAADSSGVYIVDEIYSRVLFYPGTSTTASRVYGQNGSFISGLRNNGGLATGLYDPCGIAVNASGVYIADTSNNRVLFYPGTSTTASRVYGQGGSFTSGVSNNGGVSADSLSYPCGIAATADGVYITDRVNNRVLYYAGTSTTASKVYGQGGSFTSNTASTSVNGLMNPMGVAVYSGKVYVVEYGNNRIVTY